MERQQRYDGKTSTYALMHLLLSLSLPPPPPPLRNTVSGRVSACVCSAFVHAERGEGRVERVLKHKIM